MGESEPYFLSALVLYYHLYDHCNRFCLLLTSCPRNALLIVSIAATYVLYGGQTLLLYQEVLHCAIHISIALQFNTYTVGS